MQTLAMAASALATGQAAHAKPVKLPAPGARDTCPVCGMFVAPYPYWVATVLWRDGKAVHFDGAKDFFTMSSDSVKQTVEKTTATMTLLVSAIALISLIVGGIGVMNIMLVSVTERTQEIGVRMAVGARQSDILRQFLIEAVLVCLLGGILGIALALGIGVVFDYIGGSFSMVYSMTSIVAAFGVSSLIGVVFGFLPARNAARLDPVDALSRQ